MKTVTTPTLNALQQQPAVRSAIQVIAEWNQNRYGTIASITNGGVEDYDANLFPIESIALPDRPKKGILKQRISSIERTTGIGADGFVNSGYADTPTPARYYIPSPESKYKYWTSPGESAGSTYANTPSAISNVTPAIVYTANVWANKIVVGFENSYASPTAFTISVTTDGTNWTQVAANTTIDADGRTTIYRQANGTWSTTVYRDNPQQIRGVKLIVTNMNKSKVFFNLIELSPRLESDLSAYVSEYSISNSMSDVSMVTPLGTASGNDGNVSLSNSDGRFSNDNPSSLYYGLLDKNVTFILNMGITTDSYTNPSPTYEWIRMATMRSDVWDGQDREKTNVTIQDDSLYLQSVKPNPIIYQDMTLGEIFWRLLDSVGYSSYNYEKTVDNTGLRIPYFWTDGTKSIWEVFNELTQPTQTAIYFDEYGVLQIKTAYAAYNLNKTVSWQLDAVTNGSKLADIKSLDKTFEYEANTVNVFYQKTSVSDDSRAMPAMESVWEPEGTVALRASTLTTNLTTASQSLAVTQADAKLWPYTGVVQIEGEFMRYTAKGYSYYAANGVLTHVYVDSEDKKAEYDKLNPTLSFKNYFNGYLWIGTANRGIWGTVPKAHTTNASGWTKRYRHGGGSINTWEGGWIHKPQEGIVQMATNSTFGGLSFYTSTIGASTDAQMRYLGTRMRFPSDAPVKSAGGLFISAGTNESGYMIEMIQTELAAPNRAVTNELTISVKKSDGTWRRLSKGATIAVAKNVWYDIDVMITPGASSSQNFSVFCNGVIAFNFNVPLSSQPDSNGGRCGLYTRDNSRVDFEYFYASSSTETTPADQTSRFDRIKGDWTSNQLDDDWIYSTRTAYRISNKKKVVYTQRYNQLFIDEFGPKVHEVREYDVKFDKAPVLHSRLYLSNDTQVICPEYNADSFGAKFIIGNVYRSTVIVNGSDEAMFGSENPVDQKMFIYGRVITQEDEKKTTVTNDNAIRRRGEVTVDIQSPWIQSEAAAKTIGTWINTQWAGGADEIEVESFGNPLIQIGDLVSVNFPRVSMAPATHKYFVVGVDNSYSKGLSTTLSLRRAKV